MLLFVARSPRREVMKARSSAIRRTAIALQIVQAASWICLFAAYAVA